MVVLQCISLVTAAVSYPESVIADYENRISQTASITGVDNGVISGW